MEYLLSIKSRIIEDSNLSQYINIYSYLLNLPQLNLMQVGPCFILTINYLISLDKLFIFINRVG